MKKFFRLDKPYQFDINDIIAVIYVLCAVLGIAGMNVTVLFFIGSAIGMVACFSARRINLVVLNGALFILNAVNTFKLFF